jgi:hypothetical protein
MMRPQLEGLNVVVNWNCANGFIFQRSERARVERLAVQGPGLRKIHSLMTQISVYHICHDLDMESQRFKSEQ